MYRVMVLPSSSVIKVTTAYCCQLKPTTSTFPNHIDGEVNLSRTAIKSFACKRQDSALTRRFFSSKMCKVNVGHDREKRKKKASRFTIALFRKGLAHSLYSLLDLSATFAS